MQSKLILLLALSCFSAFVAASPVSVSAPAASLPVHNTVFPRVEYKEPNLAREENNEDVGFCGHYCL
ncbi:hypothetical protein FB446DRAFT_795126 [Lentinula raphanica]|nr:hypothetical protein FB446DRAFT_795126 [Lentinula raphanica]